MKETFEAISYALLAMMILGIIIWVLSGFPKPQPINIKPPTGITQKVGEAAGNTTRRFSKGFWKGLWNRD